ncbi:SRPBCC family protein [Actinotalea sp. M2MS4P-6]|uniref:SRPBCC family protein n=1 Tax=Actinotalea sp. M2MS4P-6 TaxID=2983762 RepID=UPI0021E4B454|nr:SRPBCC family protein [Actinotalea sp. M2MS4P-6]MCV2395288.1 SRPBCC family protein [Actinotalea sp. M2MS4P-6]
MPITTVSSDPTALTLTVVGDYPVPTERLWDAWADPRQLERFWGPPTWPATVTRHDMAAGGRTEYVMTGPDGERAGGYWQMQAVDPGRSFEFVDGFADEHGAPDPALPTSRTTVVIEPTATGSRFTAVTTFPDLSAMERLVAMGMVDGMREALAQMDAVLADLAAFAAGNGTTTTMLTDSRVRVTRTIRGTVEQVWRAHHDPDLMRRWLLGPDGWTMPVCEIATTVGERYRYEWAAEDGSARFGFEGELLEHVPPVRAVTTEQMISTDGPATTNEMTLTAVSGGTLLSIVITYPNDELRDQILATGMTEGMEASYRRLEDLVLTPA